MKEMPLITFEANTDRRRILLFLKYKYPEFSAWVSSINLVTLREESLVLYVESQKWLDNYHLITFQDNYKRINK